MSRTNSHQRTHKFYSLEKELRAEFFGPARKALFNEEAWQKYKLAYVQKIENEQGFTPYEVSEKIANRHGNKRHMEARVKTKKRRIEKRSERQEANKLILNEIND
jgi:hypothetical protein